MKKIVCMLSLLFMASVANAQWRLDSEASDLSFVSIKQQHVAENFRIEKLSGRLSESGTLQVALDLNSIRTHIDIRDERLRKLLFETDKFATATLTAELPVAIMQAIGEGGLIHADVKATLKLHGFEQALDIKVTALSTGKTLLVSSAEAVLLKAEGFALQAGIAALKKLAGLSSISETTPVSFNLVLHAE